MKQFVKLGMLAFSSLIIFGSLASFSPAAPQLASQYDYDPKGWTDLLEEAGTDFKGWIRVSIPPGQESSSLKDSQWTFNPKTKILSCTGKGPHEWIGPDVEFSDFIFHVEWRFIPKPAETRYNSGIFFRNSRDGSTWHQVQMGDASGGYVFGETKTDGKAKRLNLSKDLLAKRVKPAGEWNSFEIQCEGKDVRVWANGGNIIKWKACEVTSGFLGLESEGFPVEFRHVAIKKLPAEESKK